MRSAQWAVRAYHESQLHEKNCFITLTYDDEYLPSDGKISKKHLNDFWRELRRTLPPRSVRYLACGEYGGKTRRPHYHALIFGADFRGDSRPIRQGAYTSPSVEKIWGKGLIDIAPLSMGTCCYVAGYATKKLGDPDTFVVMSRMPGLGHGWTDKYEHEIRAHGAVVIDGRRLPIPKRYFDWLWLEDIKDNNSFNSSLKSKKTWQQRSSQNVNAISRFKSKKEKI